MPVYRLVPSARSDDPNWGLSFNHGEVVVRANSTGQARGVAALEEASAYAGTIPPRVTTQVQASAFRNEHLYGVALDTTSEFQEEGAVRVLRAHFVFPDNLVVLKQRRAE